MNGLVLLSESVLRRHRGLHRVLGRAQVAVLLLLVLPSGAVMARHAFGGWPAGLSFLLLSAATAGCAIAGVIHARRGRYDRHRRWMARCYVLLCSAVVLRLTSGAAGLVGVQSPEAAYVAAAWGSWLVPLAAYEMSGRLRAGRGLSSPRSSSAPHRPGMTDPLSGRPPSVDGLGPVRHTAVAPRPSRPTLHG